jgi:hypothetical protein
VKKLTEEQASGLAYNFPLRPDFMAQLVLPQDLSTKEARRLADMLATLVTTEEQASSRRGR